MHDTATVDYISIIIVPIAFLSPSSLRPFLSLSLFLSSTCIMEIDGNQAPGKWKTYT